MSIGLILVIILIIVLLGGVGGPWLGRPDFYGYGFGHGGIGIVGGSPLRGPPVTGVLGGLWRSE